jgi:hypothetical protein
MESHELELEVPHNHGALIEAREAEAREAEAEEPGAFEGEERALDSQRSAGPSSFGTSMDVCTTAATASSAEEDETQLAAIRELMQRSFARGIWLTLGEIAEVTEFAEASISAQLRHLRKPRHGGHRVEKRRRPHGAAAAAPKIWDARRGPVIWEYRVLPKRLRGFSSGEGTPRSCPADCTDAVNYEPARGPEETDSSGDAVGRRKQELSPGAPSE